MLAGGDTSFTTMLRIPHRDWLLSAVGWSVGAVDAVQCSAGVGWDGMGSME